MPDKTTIHPKAAGAAFSDIEDIIADIRNGKMVTMTRIAKTKATC